MEGKVFIEMVSKLHGVVISNLKKQFSTFELEGKWGKENPKFPYEHRK